MRDSKIAAKPGISYTVSILYMMFLNDLKLKKLNKLNQSDILI